LNRSTADEVKETPLLGQGGDTGVGG